jgi:hypothetical protein
MAGQVTAPRNLDLKRFTTLAQGRWVATNPGCKGAQIFQTVISRFESLQGEVHSPRAGLYSLRKSRLNLQALEFCQTALPNTRA